MPLAFSIPTDILVGAVPGKTQRFPAQIVGIEYRDADELFAKFLTSCGLAAECRS